MASRVQSVSVVFSGKLFPNGCSRNLPGAAALSPGHVGIIETEVRLGDQQSECSIRRHLVWTGLVM